MRNWNAVSFIVVRSFNGTLADGSIKGKVESQRNGQPQSRDWEAKAQK